MKKEKVPNLDGKKLAKISAAILILLMIISGGALLHVENSQVEKQSQSFNVSFNVTNPDLNTSEANLGLNVGEGLNLGVMPNGTSQRRYINWSTDSYTLTRVSTEGNISDYLKYDSLVVFQGDKRYMVEIKGQETGYYEGQMKVDFQAPKTRWALKWLEFKRKHFY